MTDVVCTCGSIGADPSVVKFNACHHTYFRGDKQLESVTRVIKSTWPIPPDFSKADPAVLENARDRGVELDALFSAYVNGTLQAIPAGTRTDVVELFQKLQPWWDRLGIKAKAQVILADDEIAGTCDLKFEETIYDLKCTYDVEPTYPIQLGMYAYIGIGGGHGITRNLGIIHCTKRFKEPKLINVDAKEAMDDAMKVRDMWRLVKRRSK